LSWVKSYGRELKNTNQHVAKVQKYFLLCMYRRSSILQRYCYNCNCRGRLYIGSWYRVHIPCGQKSFGNRIKWKKYELMHMYIHAFRRNIIFLLACSLVQSGSFFSGGGVKSQRLYLLGIASASETESPSPARSQSYDRELQHQRCKNLQRHE
jgi:hypothetical protein